MDQPVRAFLDTNVLIGYYRRDHELAKLFDKTMLEKTRYVISPIVVQELILTLDDEQIERLDLDDLTTMVEIVSNEAMIDETTKSKYIQLLRSSDVQLHVNDYLNMIAARRSHCDFFVTNDAELLGLHHVSALQIVTPDAFLHLEAVS